MGAVDFVGWIIEGSEVTTGAPNLKGRTLNGSKTYNYVFLWSHIGGSID